jgi:hypothetical protein
MRSQNHEMFSIRKKVSYNSFSKTYNYDSQPYLKLVHLLEKLYDENTFGVGFIYETGTQYLEFTLSKEDNQTALFSLNGKEWEVFDSYLQIPVELHFGVFLELKLYLMGQIKGDR